MPEITDRDREKAKEIVGNWGYEEPYWWEPIAQALSKAREEGRALGQQEMKEKAVNVAFNHLEHHSNGYWTYCGDVSEAIRKL